MIVKLLTEHHVEFLSLKGGCRGSSESTHVKMPYCWKSHVTAQLYQILHIVLHSFCKCTAINVFNHNWVGWKTDGMGEGIGERKYLLDETNKPLLACLLSCNF